MNMNNEQQSPPSTSSATPQVAATLPKGIDALQRIDTTLEQAEVPP
jgi:hypothetical protein